jgi:hypothetical protein
MNEQIVSIDRIKAEAARAVESGKPVSGNPYTAGTDAHAYWRMVWAQCSMLGVGPRRNRPLQETTPPTISVLQNDKKKH